MPLRRHRALAPLSRDHHAALQLARGLQQGLSPRLRAELPEHPVDLAAEIKRRFAEEIDPHLRLEDEILVPAVRGVSRTLDEILARIEQHHVDLRRLIAELDSTDDVELTLDAFGRLLERHVRVEERELFEAIQRALAPDALRELEAPLGAD